MFPFATREGKLAESLLPDEADLMFMVDVASKHLCFLNCQSRFVCSGALDVKRQGSRSVALFLLFNLKDSRSHVVIP